MPHPVDAQPSANSYTIMEPYTIVMLALAALISTHATLNAQSVVESTTKTVTSAGTISELSPQTLVVKTESSTEPVRYTYTKSTSYVDENGVPVSMEIVKSGLPVTVYYVNDGNQLIVSKVIVRKAVTTSPVIEQKKTTTTTIDK